MKQRRIELNFEKGTWVNCNLSLTPVINFMRIPPSEEMNQSSVTCIGFAWLKYMISINLYTINRTN